MIRTGTQYLDSIRDGREVYINGERVKDVTRNPMLKPLIDIRARIYDMQHAASSREFLSYQEAGEWNAIANKLPRTQQDWWDKRPATDTVLDDNGHCGSPAAQDSEGGDRSPLSRPATPHPSTSHTSIANPPRPPRL